jgi:hypothetical protein
MKKLEILSMLLCFMLATASSSLSAQSYAFESTEREDGTAFFALNKSTGQLSYMLDHYEDAGVWKNYGGLVPKVTANELAFYVHWREEGTAFFAMDNKTGQLYFMLDYADNAGEWAVYGNIIIRENKNKLSLQASSREKGCAFFAMDEYTGQVYYMLDHSDNAGVWTSYGQFIGEH